MVEFKLVIGDPKTGKSYQREVKDQDAALFLGKKIKDVIKGEAIGLQGYELEITGGSDDCGFPMRYDVTGAARKRILAIKGVGLKKKDKGIRQRKTVCGNKVHEKISQINLKVVKEGKKPLGVAPEPAKEEEKAEKETKAKEEPEVKEEQKVEEKTKEEPEVKEEQKTEEKTKGKPEVKEEQKAEEKPEEKKE